MFLYYLIMSKILHNHPFHLVDLSPWPILMSFNFLNFMLGMNKFFYFKNYNLFMFSILLMIFCSIHWWRDVIRESTYQGYHTSIVLEGLRLGMILFIISEIFFFLSFFWTYFHMMLSPSIEIGSIWPPKGIINFNPYNIPLLNTLILLSSGSSVTWSHHSMLNNMYMKSKNSLMLTIILGVYFTLLQIFEYYNAPFTICDSIYGSIFFMTTGFHGIHVIIGTFFLFVCFIRLKYNQFSFYHHLGYEMSIWYWHFVDVIWLFLFILIYWWNY
uniref:Cytochrome c oxidase subunit 3 n=1 Tax=Xiphydria sp. ZJUH 2008002 TaxID=2488325 RepID=A0A3G5BC77_9HYME|nr:cytochrome c oxidase subunit III [Euxiphydria potanini]AYV97248.1 cytochrome c oxidase subunit 3 [Xiphydria sp. ZJUH 2008002]UYW35400.1 cytochrome c oxidase subunit 3 [Euxiphydria potanini]